MKDPWTTLLAGGLLVSLASLPGAAGAGAPGAGGAQEERMLAPELDGAEGWINTSRPVRLSDLRGKAVLLDFWTYGWINCHHVFPDLERLESKYGDRLAVIGIHSAKFPAEKVSENIRHAAARYRLRHPIANDASFKIWRAYGIRAWPTLVLIDTRGRVVGAASGEGNYDLVDRAIARLFGDVPAAGPRDEAGRPDGARAGGPRDEEARPEAGRPEALKKGGREEGFLLYPGKVAVGGEPPWLFIADTGHHRVLAADLDGRIVSVHGSGERGYLDGPSTRARFQSPEGLCLVGDTLYVADTENHAIRKLDRRTGVVSTVAGTGKQGRLRAGGKALETPLNSPWDVLAHQGALFIAMAGSHQIWRLDLSKGEVGPWIGSGREDIQDGEAADCELAQPSGLALSGGRLFIADSESSGVRAFDLGAGRLRTLVGTGLFDFGDGEGKGGHLLQHPLAVAVDGEELIIADTYNHRLKRLDLKDGQVRHWLGTGKPGAEDGERPSFFEPGGLALQGTRLYVADTNNHRIRVVDRKSGKTSTLALRAGKQEE